MFDKVSSIQLNNKMNFFLLSNDNKKQNWTACQSKELNSLGVYMYIIYFVNINLAWNSILRSAPKLSFKINIDRGEELLVMIIGKRWKNFNGD